MKWALIVVILLVVGLLLGPLWSGNTGYILIALGQWTIETSVVAAVVMLTLAIVIVGVVVRVLSRLIRRSRLGVRWFGERRKAKAQKAYQHGLKLLLQSDYQNAEQALTRAWGYEKQQATALLGAYTAQQAGHIANARNWLQRADLQDVDVALAEFLLELNLTADYSAAAVTRIREAVQAYPQHRRVLAAAAKVFTQTHAREDLRQLLPKLRDAGIKSETELAELEQQTFLEVFKAKGRSNSNDLYNYWRQLDKKQRRSGTIRLAYIQALLQLGQPEVAGKVLHKGLVRGYVSLERALQENLVRPGSNELLQYLQDRLKQQPNDATLLHALGRLALLGGDYSLAQRALKKAAEQAPSNAVHYDLAQSYQALGDSQLALQSFAKAMPKQA